MGQKNTNDRLNNLPDFIENQLSSEVILILDWLLSLGVRPRVVGGVIRDWYIYKEWGLDWDIEISHPDKNFWQVWQRDLPRNKRNLEQFLSDENFEYSVKVLSFSILRIKISDHEFEISLPRTEVYEGEGPFGHSDVKVSFDSTLDPSTSFLRRDFSINAISFEFYRNSDKTLEYKLHDPFSGVSHMEQEVLVPCDTSSQSQFYCDPVRMLRSIRFGLKLDLDFNAYIDYSKFNLEKLTKFYVIEEGHKSQSPRFFQVFFRLCSTYELELSEQVKALSPLVYLQHTYEDEKMAVVDLLKNADKTGLPFQRIEKLGRNLGLKKDWVNKVISLKKFEMFWVNFSLDELKQALASEEVNKALRHIFFERFIQIKDALIELEHRPDLLFSLFPKDVYSQIQFLLSPPEELNKKSQIFRKSNKVEKELWSRVVFYLQLVSDGTK